MYFKRHIPHDSTHIYIYRHYSEKIRKIAIQYNCSNTFFVMVQLFCTESLLFFTCPTFFNDLCTPKFNTIHKFAKLITVQSVFKKNKLTRLFIIITLPNQLFPNMDQKRRSPDDACSWGCRRFGCTRDLIWAMNPLNVACMTHTPSCIYREGCWSGQSNK